MKKLIITVFVCVLSITVFVVPAFADGGWYSYSIKPEQWEVEASYYCYESDGMGYEYWLEASSESSSSSWERLLSYSIPAMDGVAEESIINFYFKSDVGLDLSAGEVLSIDSFKGYCWLGSTASPNNYVSAVRLVVGDHLNPDFVGEWVESGNTSSSQKAWNFTVPAQTFSVSKDVTIYRVSLQFRIYKPSRGSLTVAAVPINLSWGDPNSPNAPNYSAPDSGSLDAAIDKEGELLNDTANGRTEAEGIFSTFDTHLSKVAAGLYGANVVFNSLWAELDFATPLVYISLSIGFFSFVFGLGSIVFSSFRSGEKNSYRASRYDRSLDSYSSWIRRLNK